MMLYRDNLLQSTSTLPNNCPISGGLFMATIMIIVNIMSLLEFIRVKL